MRTGVISLGEALVDFVPLDVVNEVYQKSPGGAPANVAVGVARLGAKATFLGKVGNDVLGRFLIETLNQSGVNTSAILLTDEARTGLVFVTLTENGERSFDFYINPGADRFLKAEEIDETLFSNYKIFHFGSISMINEPVKSATKKAIALAKERGMIISYDPNLRLGLWENEQKARETIVSVLSHVDILKISEEELLFITEEKEIQKAADALAQYNIPVIFVTLGAEGSYILTKQGSVRVPAFQVEVVDTTGAGDAFVSGVLYCLNEYNGDLQSITLQELERIARFASVSGALAASTKGAMTALPTLEQVEQLLEKYES